MITATPTKVPVRLVMADTDAADEPRVYEQIVTGWQVAPGLAVHPTYDRADPRAGSYNLTTYPAAASSPPDCAPATSASPPRSPSPPASTGPPTSTRSATIRAASGCCPALPSRTGAAPTSPAASSRTPGPTGNSARAVPTPSTA
jgi:hypothetical protein